MSETKRQLKVTIRWMIRKDMPEVLKIELDCFGPEAWTEEQFSKYLRNRNVIGMVAEHGGKIAGFMVYELSKRRLILDNLAVHEDCRYKGVGRAMIEKLQGKLSFDRRNEIEAIVRDRNLDAQLFFKAMGFNCVAISEDYYETCDDEAYHFEFCFEDAAVRSASDTPSLP